MKCQKCGGRYVESGDVESPPEIGGGMMGMEDVGYGYHWCYGVCAFCFLYAMFGGYMESWPDSRAIYGINCPSEQQDEPDWNRWADEGYEDWPPPRQRAIDPDISF